MRRFLHTLLAFCLVLVPVYVASDRLLSIWMKGANLPNMEIMNDVMDGAVDADIAVFGSSWPMTGFDPAVCDSITGLSSYDVTTAGGHFKTHRLMEEMYLRHNRKPRVVLQFIDCWWLIDYDPASDYCHFLPYMWNKEFRSYSLSEAGLKFNLKTMVPVLRYRSASPWLVARKHRASYKGHFTYKSPLFDPSARQDSVYISRSPGLDAAFKKQMADLKADGIQVILVYPPVFRSFVMAKRGEMAMEAYYQGVSDELDIPVLDYRDLALRNDPSRFIDADHLNAEGARELTDTLSKDLLRIGVLNLNASGPHRGADPNLQK